MARKAYDLRPVDFGEILGRSFSLFGSNIVPFCGFFLIFRMIPILIVGGPGAYLFYGSIDDFTNAILTNPERMLDLMGPMALGSLLMSIGIMLGQMIAGSGIYHMVARAYLGSKASFKETVAAVMKRAWPILGATFLQTLMIFGGLALCMAPAFLLIWAGEPLVGALALMAGMMALVIGFFWFMSVFGLQICTIMLDDVGAIESFGRSAYLTRSFRWRMVGLLVVMLVCVMVLSVPGSMFSMVVTAVGAPLAGWLCGEIWNSLVTPFASIYQVVYYFDQRCRKEGYDIAIMAAAFGVDPATVPQSVPGGGGYVPQGYQPAQPDAGYVPQGYQPPVQPGAGGHVPQSMQADPSQRPAGANEFYQRSQPQPQAPNARPVAPKPRPGAAALPGQRRVRPPLPRGEGSPRAPDKPESGPGE